ncbi:hypothetical protein BDV18DRAFT_157719 [Aspergillus unguis]
MSSLSPTSQSDGEMSFFAPVPAFDTAFQSVDIGVEAESLAQLSSAEVLDAVKHAWGATLQGTSKPEKTLIFKDIFSSGPITIVKASLETGTLPATPPATPPTTLNQYFLQETVITFKDGKATLPNETQSQINQVDKAPIPKDVEADLEQVLICLDVAYDSKWRFRLRRKPNTLSQNQADELIELFQKALEKALESRTVLPPSPAKTSFSEESDSECPITDRCIHDIVEENAIKRPDNEAVYAHDGSLSYKNLSETALKFAQELTRLGAGPEQRVAILMPKSLWYSVSVLAVLKAGAAFVPLDPGHPESRLKQLVGEIEPCALITLSSQSEKVQQLGLGCPLLEIDQLDLTDRKPTKLTPAKPNNAAYMIFTSGSTGKPKGVVIEHSALATSATTRGVVLGLGPDSRVLQYAPHTFDVSVDEILTTWIHGGCTCVPSDDDRFSIARFMEKGRVTAALLTPTSARTLSPDEVPTLRTLQTGGEVLTEDVNDKWSNRVTLFNVYGPTEASVACVISNRTGMKGTGHVLGQAVGGKCWIVSPDDVSKRLPTNEIGELVIAGPILARGYFRDPVRTESSFVRLLETGERVYRTGDLASMDADGTISYHGRKDLEIKIRGQRINIAEVEHAILQVDDVHGVVVEFPKLGLSAKRLTAVLIFKSEQDKGGFENAKAVPEAIQELLHNHVASMLPAAMVPSKWVSVPSLPQTTSGKADRKLVRGWLEHMDEHTHARLFQVSTTQTSDDALLPIWCKALKVDPQNVRLDQSFIRNGGDSIMAMEVRKLLHDAGISIKIQELLDGRTLAEIGRSSSRSISAATSTIDEDKDEPFDLSPVQQMYFEKIKDASLGLQQRVSVTLSKDIEAYHLRTALNHIVNKHRMLAAKFTRRQGKWMQQVPVGKEINSETLYRFYIEPASVCLKEFCARPMDIEEGPLLHAHLHSGEEQALVLCVHHLVADFVSWRVILQDLHDSIIAAKEGKALSIKPTLGFQQWCREQTAFASTLVLKDILPYEPGPVDWNFWQIASNTFGEMGTAEFRLSSDETSILLDTFTGSKHMTDVLLGTLALAFKSTFPERDVPTVFVEGHGREPWTPSLDVSQTVGWFTAAYPIHLPGSALESLNKAIDEATRRRVAIPSNGHPYWCARYLSEAGKKAFGQDPRHTDMEVVLNYAGTVVTKAPGNGLLGENVSISEIGHPNCPRLSVFDVGASIEGNGELLVQFSYPSNIKHASRVQEVVKTQQVLLEEVVQAEVDSDSGLPYDLANLIGVTGLDSSMVEKIYTPSSIQQDMLRRQALEPWFYRVKGKWIVEPTSGSVDAHRIAKAWKQVVAKHSTLRTAFTYSEEQESFMAVVLRDIQPAIELPNSQVRSLCRDEDLSPPHRLVLKQLGNGAVECNLEFSHIIIDAASRSIVLQDLADAYAGKLQVRPRPVPFWKYAQAVSSQSTMAGSLKPAGHVTALDFTPTVAGSKISQACKDNEITVSSFFMAAWTLVLSKRLGKDIAFDYVLSDRSAEGVEGAVGPYIRLPACRTVIDGETGMELAKKLHSTRSSQTVSTGLSLPSPVTKAQGLTTLVNIRNSGAESLTLVVGDVCWKLDSFEDPWDYDLVFAVNMHGSEIAGWTVEFTSTVSKETALGVAADLGDIVKELATRV